MISFRVISVRLGSRHFRLGGLLKAQAGETSTTLNLCLTDGAKHNGQGQGQGQGQACMPKRGPYRTQATQTDSALEMNLKIQLLSHSIWRSRGVNLSTHSTFFHPGN